MNLLRTLDIYLFDFGTVCTVVTLYDGMRHWQDVLSLITLILAQALIYRVHVT